MNTIHTEDILGSRGRVSVLRVLTNVAVPLSIRQVAGQARLSHAAAGEALDRLVELGLVAATDAGRSRVHWLERRNLVVRQMVIPLFSAEDGLTETALGELRASVPDNTYSAVLFGSRARGENALTSDFDLVVVALDQAALDEVLRHLDGVAIDLRAALGAPVSVLGYTLGAARDLMECGDNFMGGVVRDGIPLVGVAPQAWGKPDEGETS